MNLSFEFGDFKKIFRDRQRRDDLRRYATIGERAKRVNLSRS